MADAIPNPRAAIAGFFEKKVTGTQLLRTFASYPHWIAPAALHEGQPVFTQYRYSDDECHFFMFSDTQAYLKCREAVGMDVMGTLTLDTWGYSVWQNIAADVTVVNINPHSEQDLHYKQEQIARLRKVANAVEVEQALDQVLSSERGYDKIKAYQNYYFISEDDAYIALAPDSQGRKLAALFTADDTLDAFLAENTSRKLLPVPMGGEQLFSSLSKMTLLDGLVFNCSGPIAPRAFTLAFADVVLQRG